jgi:hypothetical protein
MNKEKINNYIKIIGLSNDIKHKSAKYNSSSEPAQSHLAKIDNKKPITPNMLTEHRPKKPIKELDELASVSGCESNQ